MWRYDSVEALVKDLPNQCLSFKCIKKMEHRLADVKGRWHEPRRVVHDFAERVKEPDLFPVKRLADMYSMPGNHRPLVNACVDNPGNCENEYMQKIVSDYLESISDLPKLQEPITVFHGSSKPIDLLKKGWHVLDSFLSTTWNPYVAVHFTDVSLSENEPLKFYEPGIVYEIKLEKGLPVIGIDGVEGELLIPKGASWHLQHRSNNTPEQRMVIKGRITPLATAS